MPIDVEELADQVADRFEDVVAAEQFLLPAVEDARRAGRGADDVRRRGNVGRLSRSPQAPDEEETGRHSSQEQEEPSDHDEALIRIRPEDQAVVGVVRLQAVDDGVAQVGEFVLHRPEIDLRQWQGFCFA